MAEARNTVPCNGGQLQGTVMTTPGQRSLRARLGGLATSARHGGAEQTAPARRAFMLRFEHEVDPERLLPPDERERRATAARRLYFAQLAWQSSIARSKRHESKRRGQGPTP